jgi:hypothetical protein
MGSRCCVIQLHLLQIPEALRARVTNGATIFPRTSLAAQKRRKNDFRQTIFAAARAARSDARGAAPKFNFTTEDTEKILKLQI